MNLKRLVKASKKGDGQSFVKLISQYEDILYNIATRFLNNEHDIADCMQETILSAFKNIHTLKDENYFNTWICRILINTCKSIVKKNNKVIPVNYFQEEKSYKDNLENLELDEALNTLNEKHKTVITLYYIVGLNTREISEFLNEKEGTIKSRLSRAKEILKNNYYSLNDGGLKNNG